MKLIECSKKLLVNSSTLTKSFKTSDGYCSRYIILRQINSSGVYGSIVKNQHRSSVYSWCNCTSNASGQNLTNLPASTPLYYSNWFQNQSKTYASPSLSTLFYHRPNKFYNNVDHVGYCRRSYSTQPENAKSEGPKTEEPEPEVKLSLYQRFKQMYKNYWYVLVPVHLVTSIGWGGTFYYIASSGVDISSFLETVGASERIIDLMKNSPTGYVAIAYTMYKIATPVRYSVTLGGTTFTIKYLVKRGLIKPVDSKAIKQIYSDTKGQLIEKRDQLMEKKDTLKDNIIEKKSQVLSHMAECNKKLSPKSSSLNKSNKNE